MEDIKEKEVLTADEAAMILRIPTDSLYKLLKRSDCDIPYRRIGRNLRFRKDLIMEYMKGE